MRERERGRERDIESGRERQRGTLRERERGRERDIETLTEANMSMDVGAYVHACARVNLEEYSSMPSVRTVNFIEDNPFNITYCVRSSVQHGAQNL